MTPFRPHLTEIKGTTFYVIQEGRVRVTRVEPTAKPLMLGGLLPFGVLLAVLGVYTTLA
mgnify:CR=1 FL=1